MSGIGKIKSPPEAAGAVALERCGAILDEQDDGGRCRPMKLSS
jgi:hypothetical protein